MNYRHAFHAGNFADVVKHVLLARAVAHLCRKDTAFRAIDTHAGTGRTNLQGDQATRGGEWQGGIGRVWQHPFDAKVTDLLVPYLSAIAAFNPDGALHVYPGSPLLIRQWLRPQDRMIACELEGGAAQALARNLRGDPRVKAITIDGWAALNAFIPPKEKRGLVLIDPPYEQEDELTRAGEALCAAHRKWPNGMLLLWYPIKDDRAVARMMRALNAVGLAKSLRIELSRTGQSDGKLRGTGLIAINAPWTLQNEAQILLTALARAFWPDRRSEIRVEALAAR